MALILEESVHPSPTQIHHFMLCGCQASGVPCWLKGSILVVLMVVVSISQPSEWDGESQRHPLSSVE